MNPGSETQATRYQYRVKSAAGKGMTAEQAPGGEHRAFGGTVKFDGMVGVFRASGHIAARRQQQRREEPLIEPDCEQQYALHVRSTEYLELVSKIHFRLSKNVLQGLKPTIFATLIGTAEAVPYPKTDS